MSDTTPRAREIDGEFWLNSAGVARLVYETDLDDVTPQARERIAIFKARVDAYVEARFRMTGARPHLDDALAAVVDYGKLDAALASRSRAAFLSALFDAVRS